MIISTKIFNLIALPCAMDVVAVVVTVGGEGGRGFEVRVFKQPMLEAIVSDFSFLLRSSPRRPDEVQESGSSVSPN